MMGVLSLPTSAATLSAGSGQAAGTAGGVAGPAVCSVARGKPAPHTMKTTTAR